MLTETEKVGLKMLYFQQVQSDLKIFFKLLEQRMHSQVNEHLLICLAKCNIFPIIWVAAKYIYISCKNST